MTCRVFFHRRYMAARRMFEKFSRFYPFFALSLLLSRHQVDLSCVYSLIPYCNFLAQLFTEYGFIKFTSFSLALD